MSPLQIKAKCPLAKCPLAKCPLAKCPLAKCPGFTKNIFQWKERRHLELHFETSCAVKFAFEVGEN